MAKASQAMKAVAAKVAAAQPKTASSLLTFIKTLIVPILDEALTSILAKGSNKEKFRKYLVPARDVLLSNYPLEEE